MTDPMLLGWEEFHRDARLLARRVAAQERLTGICAVARGGLIPAAILARELEVRHVATVTVQFYDGQVRRPEPDLIAAPELPAGGRGWLIVDDLADTGGTLRLLRARWPLARVATLYVKPRARSLADDWVREVSDATWVHFPWDLAPVPTPPLYGHGGDGTPHGR